MVTYRPYTPPAWQAKPLADGRVTLLVVPLKVPAGSYVEQGRIWAMTDGCAYGDAALPYAPGDLIWCREAYIGAYAYEVNEYKPKDWGNKPSWFPADGPIPERFVCQFWHKARSPVTMPKWAARTWLRCIGVEVRRVQTISEYQAFDTGISLPARSVEEHIDVFPALWDAQHAPKPRKRAGGTLPPKPAADLLFDANPWAAFVAVEKISKEKEND